MTLASNGLANAIPFRWTYADATSRAAASGFVTADLYSVALQLDNATAWILTATTPTWVALAGSGMTNPMTTAGDIIIGDTGGAAIRKAKGADSTVLTIDPSTHLPVWAAPGGGSLVALSDSTMGSDTATIDITPPASGYRDLLIEVTGRTDTSGNHQVRGQLNSDSGSNYEFQEIFGSGSTPTGGPFTGQASIVAGHVAPSNATAGRAGGFRLLLPDFLETTFHQTYRADSEYHDATNPQVYMSGGSWANTAAITAVHLFLFSTAKFKTGTRVTVWGIKAS